MNRRVAVKNNLYEKRNDLDYFIENYLDDKIYIAEYDENSTAYLLKSIDFETKICNIEIRKGQEKVVETIFFDDNKIFTIYNSDEIYFIPLDGKGLLKSNCCDFVFFNEQNFCFVEMKLNATSIDERTIDDNRKKAIKQLKNTIEHFDTQFSIDYAGLLLEAYIATPDFYPKVSALSSDIRVNFLEETRIELFEGREKKY